jgi:hypothetical protein
VVAFGRPELVSEEPAAEGDVASPSPAPEPAPAPASPARIRWAVLLARIYDVLPLLCPACGAEMRILTFLTDPPVVSAILLHLDLPHKPPPLSPARGPPQSRSDTGLRPRRARAHLLLRVRPVPARRLRSLRLPLSGRLGILLPASSPPIRASRRPITTP